MQGTSYVRSLHSAVKMILNVVDGKLIHEDTHSVSKPGRVFLASLVMKDAHVKVVGM